MDWELLRAAAMNDLDFQRRVQDPEPKQTFKLFTNYNTNNNNKAAPFFTV